MNGLFYLDKKYAIVKMALSGLMTQSTEIISDPTFFSSRVTRERERERCSHYLMSQIFSLLIMFRTSSLILSILALEETDKHRMPLLSGKVIKATLSCFAI